MPEFRTIDVGELSLRCAIEGSGPLVIFVHGFPESWYSWRHQLGPVAAAGFTACAIDVRGYGGSGKPQPVAAYAMEAIVGDLVGLATALQPDARAILVGHDWGAPIVWNSALTHPERFCAVAGLSVPFSGVPTRRITILAFITCSVLASLSGLLLAGYSTKAYQGMGDAYVLPAIAAVVIGGTHILGGRGRYLGTVVGVILIVLLNSILSIMEMPEAGRQIIYGLVIIFMLLVYGRGEKLAS